MNDSNSSSPIAGPRRPAWNKGKLTGPKPPLRPGHVWSIRAKLQLERRTRDLTLFNLAIDSKLRGCDLVALRVDDVAPNGYAVDRAKYPPEKDRPARSVRADGGDTPGPRRLSSPGRSQAGRVPVPGPTRSRSTLDDAPVRAPRLRMGTRHRPRPTEIRDALDEAHEGDLNLSSHR
jgi:hypothetical protein